MGFVQTLTLSGLGAVIVTFLAVMLIFNPKAKAWFNIVPKQIKSLVIIGIIIVGILSVGNAIVAGKGYISGLSTATIAGGTGAGTSKLTQLADVNCVFKTPGVTDAVGMKARADQSKNTHYYVDAIYTNGTGSILGNLSCSRNTAEIGSGQYTTCYVKAQGFYSEITQDSNLYYILATSQSASVVPGYTRAQTAYLQDGAGATTSSDQEKTNLVFKTDVVTENLGYYVTLPGATQFGLLNNQSSKDVSIECGGKTVATLTITKLSSAP